MACWKEDGGEMVEIHCRSVKIAEENNEGSPRGNIIFA